MNEKETVPAGLKKSQKCGHYKGICLQDGEQWIISCCCNLQICKRCNEPVYKYRCPDGVKGQLKNSFLIDLRTGKDLLNQIKND